MFHKKILNSDMCFSRSIHILIFWVLFENVMSLHRCKAVTVGLLDIGRVNEWVVTQKLGANNSIRQNILRRLSWNGFIGWFARYIQQSIFQNFIFLFFPLIL